MKKLIIANWKMNLGLAESIKLAQSYAKLSARSFHQVAVCPSFLALSAIKEILAKTTVAWGAQDVFWLDKGAYTGEVSPTNLKELGCRYVILGHSERRQYLGESCRLVNLKAKACLKAGLTPIICVGESADKKKSGANFVNGQVKRALAGIKLKPKQNLIIAYEPIWAIGSGQAIKPIDAKIMQAMIKKSAIRLLGNDSVKVIYGGSVDETNGSELLALAENDGLLVGGASLSASKLYKIANIK